MVIDVIVEIPKGSRNKYELDKESGRVRLDRVPKSSVAYPGDYGLLENTLWDDGDALDVLIINRFPTFPGCVVPSRPIALIEIIDTGDHDEKVIAVPDGDAYFMDWKDLSDIPESLKAEITEFYATYKNLEEGKYMKIEGWKDAKEAEKVIEKAKENYESQGVN